MGRAMPNPSSSRAGGAARTFNGPAPPGRAPRSWEQRRDRAKTEPTPGRRLPQPSGRGGHAIRGPVLRAAQEPRATSRGGRAGGRPYPVCPVGWGGATSVPRADAARPGRSPAAEAQLWRDRRRLHGFAASGRKLFAQLGRPSPRCGEGSRFRARPGPAPRPARSRGRTRRGWGPPTPGLPGSPPASPRLRLGRQQTLGWVPGVTTRPGRSEPATGAKGVPQPGRGRGQGYPRGPSPGPGHERRAASAAFRAREGERAAQAPRELAAAPQVVAAGTGLPPSRARLQPTGNWRPKAPPVPGVSPAARPPAERSLAS